jgi:LacI family transcriptional regulator
VDTALASGRGILRGIVRFAHEYGSWLIYHEPRSIGETPPAWLRNWRGDGIIARLQNRRIAQAVVRARIPAVDVLGVTPLPSLPIVHVDDKAIAQMAAEHLLERGFTTFGFYNMKGVNWSERRCHAFSDAVARDGYPCSICSVPPATSSRWSWEMEQDRLADWLRRLPKPAGVMICSDWRGQNVMEACRRAGITVPDEVAVVGVDNDAALCEACDPPLSSVVPDYERVGFEAASSLERLMTGKPPLPSPVLIKPVRVQARRSTDILAITEGPVAAAVRLIREKACTGLTVEDIVRQVPMSRSVLQRRFREVLGRTIHDEIINTRLAEARFLLTESDLPIALVAEKAGFKYQEYMGAVFKARLGITPLQVRRARGLPDKTA